MAFPNQKEYKIDFFGRELKFIISGVAEQANASVIGQYGDTSVLVTVVMGKQDKGTDFFPLTVDYEERFYAAGKIIGSRFIRREGRPSDVAVLSGRLVDRSIRPLFDPRMRRDVQVVITILSFDEENDPDFVALATASLALSISNIPCGGPVAGVRVLSIHGRSTEGGKTNDGPIFNPTYAEVENGMKQSGAFDAFFSGNGEKVNMIEISGNEAKESEVADVFSSAKTEIKKIVDFQNDIKKEIGKKKSEIALIEHDKKVVDAVRSFAEKRLENILYTPDKKERDDNLADLQNELLEHLKEKELEDVKANLILDELINEIVHKNILREEKRPDGRKLMEIRPLNASIGLFKRLHGSALFMRGQTQSLAVTTLAAPTQEQLVETMEISMKRRFMLHYNFPPYSVGETGRMGMPSRREIGHGALAEKALKSVIPSQEKFPYTIRIVSEILSSNGSSSMASVCAGTLSLMDAGVPISNPVAGIAMGLMTHQGYDIGSRDKDFKVLTDIQGPEDHYGDMDLKIAGTRNGITAVQMDVKVDGITDEIFGIGLEDGKKARNQILDLIEKTISEPRKELSKYAPVILTTEVKTYQIGEVIGSGGKVINGMIEKFGLISIDINDDGRVFVTASDVEKAKLAIDYINQMTKEYAVGDIVEGEIVKMFDFGAILDLGGKKDGMIHVSEIKSGFVKSPSDLLKLGQKVRAKVISSDPVSGKIGLSIKQLENK